MVMRVFEKGDPDVQCTGEEQEDESEGDEEEGDQGTKTSLLLMFPFRSPISSTQTSPSGTTTTSTPGVEEDLIRISPLLPILLRRAGRTTSYETRQERRPIPIPVSAWSTSSFQIRRLTPRPRIRPRQQRIPLLRTRVRNGLIELPRTWTAERVRPLHRDRDRGEVRGGETWQCERASDGSNPGGEEKGSKADGVTSLGTC